jgi:cohesin complex subunit SCC1
MFSLKSPESVFLNRQTTTLQTLRRLQVRLQRQVDSSAPTQSTSSISCTVNATKETLAASWDSRRKYVTFGCCLLISQCNKQTVREDAAKLFYELLLLKTRGFIDVAQSKPFGDITITPLVRCSCHLTESLD